MTAPAATSTVALPFAAESLTGLVVLVDRGACNFTLKINNVSAGRRCCRHHRSRRPRGSVLRWRRRRPPHRHPRLHDQPGRRERDQGGHRRTGDGNARSRQRTAADRSDGRLLVARPGDRTATSSSRKSAHPVHPSRRSPAPARTRVPSVAPPVPLRWSPARRRCCSRPSPG